MAVRFFFLLFKQVSSVGNAKSITEHPDVVHSLPILTLHVLKANCYLLVDNLKAFCVWSRAVAEDGPDR